MFFYFLNFIANLAAAAHDRTVKPIGNTPLVSISGTCSSATVPELYIAATTGKATSPITPSFVFVLSEETFSCMLYVLMFNHLSYVLKVLRRDLTFLEVLIRKWNKIILAVPLLNKY